MRKNYKTKRITYKNAELEVRDDGAVLQNGKQLNPHLLGRNLKYAYVRARKIGKAGFELVNVARAVCQAFHRCKSFESMQVDHIDCNTLNNNASNLRWVTRKFNNSRQHALKLRSENAKSICREDQILKALNADSLKTIYFDTAKEAAAYFGCSRQSIYLSAMNPTGRLQWKWIVSWIPRCSEEAKIAMSNERK